MSYSRYDDAYDRGKLYCDTLAIVRELIGPEHRLTTMKGYCACCKELLYDKEGEGATGDSHTVCPTCTETLYPEVAAEMRAMEVAA